MGFSESSFKWEMLQGNEDLLRIFGVMLSLMGYSKDVWGGIFVSALSQTIRNTLVFSSILLVPQLVLAGGGGGGGGVRSASVSLSLLPLLAAALSVSVGVWLRKSSK